MCGKIETLLSDLHFNDFGQSEYALLLVHKLNQKEGMFYETRDENYLFAAKGADCCRVCGSGCTHVLGIGKPQGGRCRSH